ncbi:Choline-phosphate cytidylyltransferase A [Bonamia ostreae]|uniref:choline-phosphate cytidylyltransferase n=1 Tax=Bonamia ostreae TaxID=126728 RepID=A0ABV2AND4_9EUKA
MTKPDKRLEKNSSNDDIRRRGIKRKAQSDFGQEGYYRIYLDGIFDLFHFGHARLFKQIKTRFPNSTVIAGVCADDLVNKRKGKTVLNSEERYESLEHCKWVDEVIQNAPWTIDQKFLDLHKIDYVAHDPIPYTTGNDKDTYSYVKSIGRFIATDRTEGISTSDIINRVVKDYDKFVRRNLKKGYSRQEMNVGFLKEKRIKVAGKMDEMRNKVDQIKNRVKDKGDEVFDSSKNLVEKWYENSQKYIDEFLQMFGRDGRINAFMKNKVNSIEKKIKDITKIPKKKTKIE